MFLLKREKLTIIVQKMNVMIIWSLEGATLLKISQRGRGHAGSRRNLLSPRCCFAFSFLSGDGATRVH